MKFGGEELSSLRKGVEVYSNLRPTKIIPVLKEIRIAIQKVLEKGYRTPDLYEEGTEQIKVGTNEMTDKIIEKITKKDASK